MYDDYQLRKDINRVITFLNNLEKIEDDDSILALLKEELGKYYDSSEVDVISDKLNNDLEVLDDSLTDLTGSLIEFNDELISFDKDNNNLKGDLSKLKDNLHRFTSAVDGLSTDLTALDTSLSNLSDDVDEYGDAISGLQSSNSQLSSDLTSLDSSLTQLETDVDGYGTSIDNLLAAVGDNNSGLVKSLNTLQTVVGDSNSGLVKQANDTSSSVTQLGNDLTTLNGSLTTLSGTVGDNSKGLVKQVNDLSSSVDDFDSDLTTLDGNLSSLTGIVGSNSSGLVKDLNDLTSTVNSLDNNVFGTNGLASRLTATENSLGTTNSDLGKLVYSLNTLSDYLTTFEGTLDEFEEELESNPNIDVSDLNANIVALFGVIGSVKNDVSTVESDITQAQTDISNTNGSINNVKTDLYGTKVVDGQTVPKDPTDTPSNDSLKKNLQNVKTTVGDKSGGLVKDLNDTSASIGNVKTDLYGTGTASSPQAGSVKANVTAVKNTVGDSTQGLVKDLNDAQSDISTVQDDIYGDGQNKQGVIADLSDLTGTITDEGGLIDQLGDVGENVDSVKGEIYGTKTITVDGQQVTVPKDSTDTPSSDSVIGKANAIKNDLYGTGGTASQPSTGSVKGNINKVVSQDIPNVNNAITNVDTKADNVKKDLYGTKTVNGQTVPKEKTDTPDANSVKGLINKVDNDINNQTTGLKPIVTELDNTVNDVDTGIDAVNGHIGTIQGMMYGSDIEHPSDGSLMKKIDTAEDNIETVQTDIGEVEYDVNSDLQTQIKNIIAIMGNLFPTVHEVNNLNECSAEDTTSPRGNRYVVGNYNYDNVFDKSTNKYYQCQYLQSNPPLGYYGEWVQINDPIVDFANSGLNSMVSAYFAAKTHTHSTSDITGLGTWESVNTGISGVTFYVNQTLRLVEFNYDMNSYSFIAGYNAIGTLPSTYIPKTHITLSLRSGIQYGYVDKDDMKIYIHNNGAGTANVHASGMWHY